MASGPARSPNAPCGRLQSSVRVRSTRVRLGRGRRLGIDFDGHSAEQDIAWGIREDDDVQASPRAENAMDRDHAALTALDSVRVRGPTLVCGDRPWLAGRRHLRQFQLKSRAISADGSRYGP